MTKQTMSTKAVEYRAIIINALVSKLGPDCVSAMADHDGLRHIINATAQAAADAPNAEVAGRIASTVCAKVVGSFYAEFATL